MAIKLDMEIDLMEMIIVARIIWRHSRWPLNISIFEDLLISHWIKAVLDPRHLLAIPCKEVDRFQLFAAITKDAIWCSRNQVIHMTLQLDISFRLHQINVTMRDHEQAWSNLSLVEDVW